jgi:hypothetical protein
MQVSDAGCCPPVDGVVLYQQSSNPEACGKRGAERARAKILVLLNRVNYATELCIFYSPTINSRSWGSGRRSWNRENLRVLAAYGGGPPLSWLGIDLGLMPRMLRNSHVVRGAGAKVPGMTPQTIGSE